MKICTSFLSSPTLSGQVHPCIPPSALSQLHPHRKSPSNNMSQNQPTPNQQNMVQMIQPAQATRLLEALKEELAQAKAAGADTAKARQHYARAEQIKQVLVNYRQQQQQKAAAARASTPTGSAGTQNIPSLGSSNMAVPPLNPSMGAAQQFPGSSAGAGMAPGGASMGGVAAAANTRGGMAASPQNPASAGLQRSVSITPGVTPEKYNRVRTGLQDLERKIRALEAGKRPDMKPEETTQIDNQLRELRLKYGQYSKYALYMKNQLLELARAAGTAPLMAGSPAPKPGTPSAPPSAHVNNPAGTLVQSVPTPAVTNALLAASNANVAHENSQQSGPQNASASGAGTPMKTGSRGASPAVKDPTIPGVSLALITKTSVPSIPISNTINVRPQNPITLKPGANNVRPTLTAGASSGLGQIVNSPAVVRMPTFDMASTGPLQDNSGRVLTKRKLTELVNTIGADEGDGKTTVDGDVEELLLDLADEFVSSVTTFACRLAKHRKTDTVDVRDVQLHLERNWNIRIPGYAMDEIRNMRKWQPSSSHNQKVSGVDIVKAVNGNIN